MPSPRAVRLVQQIRASRDHLWTACATPRGMASWQADQVSGLVQVGHHVVLEWPALGAKVELEIVRANPPERLLMASGDTTVELRIEDGSVTLTHEGLEPEDDADGFAASWRVTLALLAHAVEQHSAGSRETEWWLRPVRTTPESAYTLFTTAAGLETWLGDCSDIGPIGSEYEVRLSDSATLQGRVLANVHGHAIALSVRSAANAAIQLRTLPSPETTEERLVALVWSSWNGEALDERTGRSLGDAFDRLCAALARGGQG